MLLESIIGIIAVLAGIIALFLSASNLAKVEGRFRAAQIYLIIGLVFGFLCILSLFLEDFSLISIELAHALVRIFIALAAIFVAVSSHINNGLYKNIPSALLEKLK